jgi:uncharacterized membrane protein YbaN (DUF454 family)
MRLIWIALGLTALALGLVGLVLPLLPTTPFMLLAAASFAKSSPRLHDWLVGHPVFGPAIRNWREHRAIAPKAKRLALIAMAAAFGLSLVLGLGWKVLAVQAAVLGIMGSWIWTRPDGPDPDNPGAP